MSDSKKEEAWCTQERRCRYSLLQLCGTANKRAGKSLKWSQIREILSVHGTHTSRRKSKKIANALAFFSDCEPIFYENGKQDILMFIIWIIGCMIAIQGVK